MVLMTYLFQDLYRYNKPIFTKDTFNIMIDIFIESMLIIILSVPEGLPMVLTLSLAYGVHEMQKDKILIRKLNTCYVMGGANNLCIDKTGTITKCNLRVTQAFLYGDQEGFSPASNKKIDFNLLTVLCDAVLATSNSGQAVNTSISSNGDVHNSSSMTIMPTVIRLSRTD